jgi:hypothetical protein
MKLTVPGSTCHCFGMGSMGSLKRFVYDTSYGAKHTLSACMHIHLIRILSDSCNFLTDINSGFLGFRLCALLQMLGLSCYVFLA